MFSGSLKRLGFMPERFQAAFGAQRVGSKCPPYPVWMFCKNSGLPCKPLPTRTGINARNADSRGAIAARALSGCLGTRKNAQAASAHPTRSRQPNAWQPMRAIRLRRLGVLSAAFRLPENGLGRVGTRCPRVPLCPSMSQGSLKASISGLAALFDAVYQAAVALFCHFVQRDEA